MQSDYCAHYRREMKPILIVIALIFCITPVLAISYIHYDPITEVTSKYVTTNSITSDGKGELDIQTRSHNALLGTLITIQQVNATGHTFVNGDRIAKETAMLYDTFPETRYVHLSENGNFNQRVWPSVYLITLLNGNGGQPEYAIAEATANYKVSVGFIGSTVSDTTPPRIEPPKEIWYHIC